jgi:hypothetical protein
MQGEGWDGGRFLNVRILSFYPALSSPAWGNIAAELLMNITLMAMKFDVGITTIRNWHLFRAAVASHQPALIGAAFSPQVQGRE